MYCPCKAFYSRIKNGVCDRKKCVKLASPTRSSSSWGRVLFQKLYARQWWRRPGIKCVSSSSVLQQREAAQYILNCLCIYHESAEKGPTVCKTKKIMLSKCQNPKRSKVFPAFSSSFVEWFYDNHSAVKTDPSDCCGTFTDSRKSNSVVRASKTLFKSCSSVPAHSRELRPRNSITFSLQISTLLSLQILFSRDAATGYTVA